MEDTKAPAPGTPGRWRRSMIALALVGTGVVAGGVLAGTQIAGAATASGNGASSTMAPAGPGAGMMDPATVPHGPGETLLTGATADKVTSAAEQAVPNGTIVRVETDPGGAAYEAHVQKADGSFVTVKLDSAFTVTSTEPGFGPGPGPMAPPANGNG